MSIFLSSLMVSQLYLFKHATVGITKNMKDMFMYRRTEMHQDSCYLESWNHDDQTPPLQPFPFWFLIFWVTNYYREAIKNMPVVI